jgi:hypothetical protein
MQLIHTPELARAAMQGASAASPAAAIGLVISTAVGVAAIASASYKAGKAAERLSNVEHKMMTELARMRAELRRAIDLFSRWQQLVSGRQRAMDTRLALVERSRRGAAA